MAFFDMPLDQLQTYKPEREEPADFDAFWQQTLDQAREHPLNATFAPVDYGLALVDTYDVTFTGYGGQPVKGWFLLPRGHKGPLPCVVEFIGYGGGRGFGFEHILWPNMGYAYLIMDTRGQGSAWRQGDTADVASEGSSPSVPGFMTQGILDPKTYYYRRVFTDSVRAVEAARSHDAVDASRIAATGGSQGGGITLAVSGLDPSIEVAMPDVPFLCHYRRATTLVDSRPYGEITDYCKTHRDRISTVFNTLSYFDGVNFAARIKARTLFSVGLMDTICPPSTVYAAYNQIASDKSIRIYEFNNHEGGGPHHMREKLQFLKAIWG